MSGTLRLAALRELFAGPLVSFGRRNPLLDPSLVIDPATPAEPLSTRRGPLGAGIERCRRARSAIVVN
ncbi:MAG: hypothetical protein KIT43_10430 [Bauldia sp.]|nr:hypothetical protein [Bauldia sp.]